MKTFKLGFFVTIVPYWYNQCNKYCQSVKEANLCLSAEGAIYSAQDFILVWAVLLFAIPPIFHLAHSLIVSLQLFSPVVLYCFPSLFFDEKSAIVSDNWGSVFLWHCFLQSLVVWYLSQFQFNLSYIYYPWWVLILQGVLCWRGPAGTSLEPLAQLIAHAEQSRPGFVQ